MIEGRIIKGIGGFYYVDTDNGLYECRARGIFRKNKITPLVGDFVKISVVDEENKKGVVEEIAERETELVRPPIANVNKALIVFAVKNPTPHLSLLDRFIVLEMCIRDRDVYRGTSITSVAVAAHECGHAIQHCLLYTS